MNIEEVEEPKKHENLQTKPVLDPFKSTADTRKVRELPRKMNIEEVEEPETTKIYRQKPRAPVRATRKLRKFTDETNMLARNHENSDEFRALPVRHLDLDTRAFYHYRKNPKCYHTVWGKIHLQKPMLQLPCSYDWKKRDQDIVPLNGPRQRACLVSMYELCDQQTIWTMHSNAFFHGFAS